MSQQDRCFIGDDFVIHFPEAKNALGQTIDLTGATLTCSVKARGGVAIPASAGTIDEPATAGKCRATFYASATLGFVAETTYSFDGVVVLSNGEIHTVGEGTFRAVARVTAQPT